jgi:hypothetical protein
MTSFEYGPAVPSESGSVPSPSAVGPSSQSFPDGADVFIGDCDGLCHRLAVHIAYARIGPSWRQAIDVHLCAECLADYVIGAPMVNGHVYAMATDGLYRELKGDLVDLVDEKGTPR